jgi:hypothetical protein
VTDANAEVTVVNALAHAEALRRRLVQTMGQRARSERLVHTRVGVQHAAKTRGAAHGQPRDALGVRAGRRTVSPHHPSAA